MSTAHIPQLPQQLGHAKATAKSVRDRARELRDELSSLEGTDEDIDIQCRTLHQYVDDLREPLVEEGQQLSGILHPTPPPAPLVTPIVAVPPATPAPAAPVAAPVQPIPTTPPPVTPVVVPPIVVQTPPPAGPTIITTQTDTNPFNPRCWSWVQWLFALLFGAIGLLIAVRHRRNVNNWFEVHHGPAVWWMRAGWIVLITVIAVELGAALGWYLDRRICRGRSRRALARANATQVTVVSPTTPRRGVRQSLRDGWNRGSRRNRPQQLPPPAPPAATTPPPAPPAAPTP